MNVIFYCYHFYKVGKFFQKWGQITFLESVHYLLLHILANDIFQANLNSGFSMGGLCTFGDRKIKCRMPSYANLKLWKSTAPTIHCIYSIYTLYNTVQYTLQVSWIRHGDTMLLTVGRYTYTPDTRFSALHPVLTAEWQLRIAGVQKRYGYKRGRRVRGVGGKN